MAESVYKIIELVGTSPDSWEKAAKAAVERARERLAKNPDFAENLERLGRERALIYKTLVMTGLRKGELASLTFGQLELDAAHPYHAFAGQCYDAFN